MILLSDSVTLGQTKYTERFKNAAEYRQAWIANILGEDESHGMLKHALIPQFVLLFCFVLFFVFFIFFFVVVVVVVVIDSLFDKLLSAAWLP